MHYVLSGTVRNVIHSNKGDCPPKDPPKDCLPKDTIVDYTVTAGDVGYVPKNFVHYIEVVGGPATIVVTFNHPNWGNQGFSGMMSVTPTHISAATLRTTKKVVNDSFPKKSVAFLKRRGTENEDDTDDLTTGVE